MLNIVCFKAVLTWATELKLSLGKTRHSPYSFCCSTALQGHPRSMILCHLKANMRFSINDN